MALNEKSPCGQVPYFDQLFGHVGRACAPLFLAVHILLKTKDLKT